MRLIDADELKQQFIDKLVRVGLPPEKAEEFAKTAFDAIFKIIDATPTIEAEPVKRTIEKFRDYQIEWLTAHNDIEFCEEEENLIIRFLKDTAECAIKFGMDEVEE